MKKTTFTAIIICAVFSASSQVVVIKRDSMPVAGKLYYSPYSSSRIIGKSPKGIVYALPKDRMPVLRPDTTIVYHMPVIPLRQKKAMTAFPKPPAPNPLLPKKQKEMQLIKTPDGSKQIKIH